MKAADVKARLDIIKAFAGQSVTYPIGSLSANFVYTQTGNYCNTTNAAASVQPVGTQPFTWSAVVVALEPTSQQTVNHVTFKTFTGSATDVYGNTIEVAYTADLHEPPQWRTCSFLGGSGFITITQP